VNLDCEPAFIFMYFFLFVFEIRGFNFLQRFDVEFLKVFGVTDASLSL